MIKAIHVKLYANERDFIVNFLEYVLLDDLLNKLKRAKSNKENMITISLRSYDLEQLIGNLSLEANHSKKPFIQEFAYKIAEKLESYVLQLKQ